MRILALLLLSLPVLAQVEIQAPQQFRRDLLQDPAYLASLTALAVAHSADHQSSIGRYELNPVLRDGSGRYDSTRGVALKAGSTVGLVLLQRWIVRKHPRMRKPVLITNYILAGWFGGIAVRNHQIGGAR